LDFYCNHGGRVVIMCIEEVMAQGKLQQNLGLFLSLSLWLSMAIKSHE